MKTVKLPYKMMCRKPLRVAPLLVLMLNVFRGHALTCHWTEYQKGDECCPRCPPGNRVNTDCTQYTSTSCRPCNEGTFMDQDTGLKQCIPCATCDAGSGLMINTSCTRTSNAVCEPLEGFFCMDSREDGCVAAQKHKRCQPGQYISQNGTALRDAVCSDCSAGTFSDGTFTSCLPHTQCELMNLQLIKPGSASMDAECGEQSSGINPGLVIGVVLVVLLLFLVPVLLVWYLKKKNILPNTKRMKNGHNIQETEDLNGEEKERHPEQLQNLTVTQ